MKTGTLGIATALLTFMVGIACAQSEKPPGVEVRLEPHLGTVPDYFMLNMTDPGCDPDEDCDDVGPPKAWRNWYLDQTLCNVGGLSLTWRDCEKTDPGDGEPVFDFSDVTMSERNRRMKYKIGHIRCGGAKWIIDPAQGIGPPWVEKDEFKFEMEDGKKVVSDRYWKRYEDFVEAACRFAREKYGVTIFSTGGNERDLVSRDTYKDFYPDWHFYYMAPVKHIHAAMKRAHPENRLMIGNMCYTDAAHVGALYQAGAKGNFEILAIHNYGKKGVHLDMFQIIEGHNEMVKNGDGDIGIWLVEGWSCFPLPEYIDRDTKNRQPGGRTYSAEDAEHYRQTVLDGWRNIMTPRKDEYDPRWVIGANYFVLNDHWGGRGWEKRGVAVFEMNGQTHEVPATEYDGRGKIKAFKLDGYTIGTTDPLWIKPFLRPWGLIDIHGKPKGDIVFNFPPYLPKHNYEAVIDIPIPDGQVATGFEYPVTVRFTNLESTPMTDFRMDMIGRDEPAKQVKYQFVGGDDGSTVMPGETITRRYTAEYPSGLIDADPYRARGFADAHYTWEGRPYHTDAWMPKAKIGQPITLKLGDGKRSVLDPEEEAIIMVVVENRSHTRLPVSVQIADIPAGLEVTPEDKVVETQNPGNITTAFVAKLKDPANTGIYELKFSSLDGVEDLIVPVSFSNPGGEEPGGLGLRNPSFEQFDPDSGYAFWEGEKTNWINNGEAENLPGAGERAYGAATDWLTFDYTIGQTVDLPEDARGKKVKATSWFVGRGWDAGATGNDVQGRMNLVLLDGEGNEIRKKDGPVERGTDQWRQISLVSDPVPENARRVRLELCLESDTENKGCRRGAMDMVKLELVP